jgi:hypothetical protein
MEVVMGGGCGMEDVTIDGNSTSRFMAVDWIFDIQADRMYLINLDAVSGPLRGISFSVMIGSNYGRIVSNLSCRAKALFRYRVQRTLRESRSS